MGTTTTTNPRTPHQPQPWPEVFQFAMLMRKSSLRHTLLSWRDRESFQFQVGLIPSRPAQRRNSLPNLSTGSTFVLPRSPATSTSEKPSVLDVYGRFTAPPATVDSVIWTVSHRPPSRLRRARMMTSKSFAFRSFGMGAAWCSRNVRLLLMSANEPEGSSRDDEVYV